MRLEDIRAALDEALVLRSPVFAPDTLPREKVSALESYMLRSAHVNGNLVEARHWLRTLRVRLSEEWEQLKGWEVAVRTPRARMSQADVQRAKVEVAPQKYEAGREAKLLSESIDDQIVRLEREERVCSRAYSMVAGQ